MALAARSPLSMVAAAVPARAPRLALAAVLLAAVAGCAAPRIGAAGPAVRATASGDVLADQRGMTLYTYDKDPTGGSACTGLCAVVWPPATAGKGAAPSDGFSLIARSDGTRQWADDGRPLYAYVGDGKPGDVTGNGVDGVWHVARP